MNGITSSRRRFASHLLPDLQAAIISEIAPFNAVLLGTHQPREFEVLTMSALLILDGHSVASVTPFQYQDMDIGEEEPFAALNNGLWLFRVKDTPFVVLLSHYFDPFIRNRFAQVEIAHVPVDAASQFACGNQAEVVWM